MKEFELIDFIKESSRLLPNNNFEGIGDDCAQIQINENKVMLFSTDILTEDIHFRRSYPAVSVGKKSAAVNVSDIAAMGAKARAALLSISLPSDIDEKWEKDFILGFTLALKQYDVQLIGGDTTSSASKITISVTIIGEGNPKCIKRRCDAIQGDDICVTGVLGLSVAGLKELSSCAPENRYAINHLEPRAHDKEGIFLGVREEVHAMMDLSDGIASDLKHILNASKVSAEIYTEDIPKETTLEDALCGGEDYVLLLTSAHEKTEKLQEDFKSVFNRELYKVGRITEGRTGVIRWMSQGKELKTDFHGYEHLTE
ncbi:MAG: thiamine-phosphate kinase [Alistipes sp.]|nr:thiamine-phosphate kinase [Candidatus Alistipes equi]